MAVPEQKALCVVLHDVAPATWPDYRPFVDAVDAMGRVPLTLLVVPDYHRRGRVDRDRAFCAEIDRRQAAGDEIALHGYYHFDDAPPPRTLRDYIRRRIFTHEGEFSAIALSEARRRVDAGLTLFGDLGWAVAGFVPPGWLPTPGLGPILSAAGLCYTSTPQGIADLVGDRWLHAPSLVYSARSGWRRAASSWWNRRRLAREAAAPCLRLGLHPMDIRHTSSRRFWLDTLAALLAERRALTKIAWIRQAA